jgi:uroporphyrinogen-III synthase
MIEGEREPFRAAASIRSEGEDVMAGPLAGRTIALAEGRQLEELVRLLEAEGAVALRYPLLSILDAPDAAPVLEWIRDLIAGRFSLAILMTGEAVRRMLALASREKLHDDFVAALGRTPTLTRGPKPALALKEIGLAATKTARAPTTDGVIATLRQETLAGKMIGYTLSGVPNPTLEGFLTEAGATPRAVLPYVYAPGSSKDRVGELIGKLAAGSIDVLLFTSSPQIDRLFEVGKELGVESELAAGLRRVRIAAVGPVVAETLRARGLTAAICPEQGWVMKNLVQHIRRDLEGDRPA